MSNVVSFPPKTLREAGIRKAVHELPPDACLPGALLFSFFGRGLMASADTEHAAATEPAAPRAGQRR